MAMSTKEYLLRSKYRIDIIENKKFDSSCYANNIWELITVIGKIMTEDQNLDLKIITQNKC